MTFDQLNLSPLLLKAVAAEGYETPTPVIPANAGIQTFHEFAG